ncbi:MAG: NAD-dependent epimerase/dehydratase family protein [Anaerolineae bacterium]|nr:NAD-dependent epimerase/dehydratase family protein [Anaerolineae bacterium]
MNILILGGTRFIGVPVVWQLQAAGHRVAVFTRGRSAAPLPDGVLRLTGDIAALDEARDAFAAFAPDVILHNVILTAEHAATLMRVGKGLARRVVMLSSLDVYRAYGRLHGSEPGPIELLPLTEDSPLREQRYPYRATAPAPDHPFYNYDKIPAEQIVLGDPDLPGTVLRLPMVIGPRDYQRRLLPFLRPMLDGRPAIVMAASYAAWRSTYGYVDNVAAAIALACTDERAAGRVYNVADASPTIHELAGLVAEAVGWTGRLVIRPDETLPPALRPEANLSQHLVASAARITAELGYRPAVPLVEAVRRTVAWERDNPPDSLPEGLLHYEAEDEVLRGL